MEVDRDANPFHGAGHLRVPGETKTHQLMRRRAAAQAPIPASTCRICERPATRFKGSTAFCALHFEAVNQIVNAGRTDGVRAIVEAHQAVGSLRDKLWARRRNEQGGQT